MFTSKKIRSVSALTEAVVQEIEGVHHVTAIAGEQKTNINFHTGILRLRLVKRTVNFDDPTT